eukprot:1046378_1
MESCTDDKVLFIEAPSLEFLHKKPEWSFKNNVLRRIGLHDLRHVFTLFLILGITMYITYRFELSRMEKDVTVVDNKIELLNNIDDCANSESENQPRTGAKLDSENEPRITGAKFESENKPRTEYYLVDDLNPIKHSRSKPPLQSYSASIKSDEKKEDPTIYFGPINSGRAESYRIDNANHADGINGNNGYNQSEGVEYNKQSEGVEYNKQSEGVNDNKQSDNDAEGGNNNKQSDMKKKHQQDKPFVRQGITSQPEKPVPRPIENDNDDESIKDQPQKPSPRILASSDDTQSQETPENKKGKYKKVKDNDSSDERWKHGSKPTG